MENILFSPIYGTILLFICVATHSILLIVLLLLLNVAGWNEMQARENPVEKCRFVKEFFQSIKIYIFQLPISDNLRVKLFSAQPKTRRKTLLHVPKKIICIEILCVYIHGLEICVIASTIARLLIVYTTMCTSSCECAIIKYKIRRVYIFIYIKGSKYTW